MARKPKKPKGIDAYDHEAARLNTPTAELSGIAEAMEATAPMKPSSYKRAYPLAEGATRERDTDFDPQIIWDGAELKLTDEQIEQLIKTGRVELGHAQLTCRGKDTQDWSDLVVNIPPIYVQEKIHPQAIIAELKRATLERKDADAVAAGDAPPDLFAESFAPLDPEATTEFYQHDVDWANRLILGDSLQVMASLAERERLRGKVQCIYFDPPYGIKFNSNWQVSTMSRDVKDGKLDSATREPEQMKAFRDTWKDGIHSYLTYLRDRLTVARDLLTDSGSIFVQIGDENVHRVRALMDEVFGEENALAMIQFKTKIPLNPRYLGKNSDFIVWFAKDFEKLKFRRQYRKRIASEGTFNYGEDPKTLGIHTLKSHPNPSSLEQFTSLDLKASGYTESCHADFTFEGHIHKARTSNSWKTTPRGMYRLGLSNRVAVFGSTLRYKQKLADYPIVEINNSWTDTAGASGKEYIVQTSETVIKRCMLMATCLLYTSPSPRDRQKSRMPSSA